jgi:hypothetical protein
MRVIDNSPQIIKICIIRKGLRKMITQQQADVAADKVLAKFEKEPWFGGVGIAEDGADYCVQLYSNKDGQVVPETIDGVKVKLVTVTLQAQKK